ncbi:hypothetical protein EVAR_39781_1 [Eumeta japonica]|uniref:Uncharacterized protein n=1 Tax=Eumeta variegata TaxID=151549 RepID=A0A4C1X752_EUMVA|nr:hypothetical protein EVAR_39781_1 [Eumeta japonica]
MRPARPADSPRQAVKSATTCGRPVPLIDLRHTSLEPNTRATEAVLRFNVCEFPPVAGSKLSPSLSLYNYSGITKISIDGERCGAAIAQDARGERGAALLTKHDLLDSVRH